MIGRAWEYLVSAKTTSGGGRQERLDASVDWAGVRDRSTGHREAIRKIETVASSVSDVPPPVSDSSVISVAKVSPAISA